MTQHKPQRPVLTGAGQLTLVENSLCPLDVRKSLRPGLVPTTTYDFTDSHRKRSTGRATVLCPRGLTAADELFLWGLLALTLADPQSDGELYVTRHFLLRELGIIDARSRRGGRQYDQLTAALKRLAPVKYENDSFYDPIRAEHRRVGFGFISYSLPLGPDSSRAWRIVWDPLFFELAQAAGGALSRILSRGRDICEIGTHDTSIAARPLTPRILSGKNRLGVGRNNSISCVVGEFREDQEVSVRRHIPRRTRPAGGRLIPPPRVLVVRVGANSRRKRS